MLSKVSTDISTEAVSACLICGEKECSTIYENLEDRLFGAPGKWSFKRCVNCGLVYLDPCPTIEDINKTYTTAYAGRKKLTLSQKLTPIGKLKRLVKAGFFASAYGYKKGVPLWQRILALPVYLSPYWREQLAFGVMDLPFKKGGRLLDIGCGIGGFLEQMSDLGWETEGLDTDPKVVQICRSSGLAVREGTLESQDYPDDYFDAVTMKHVIEHIHDPISLLKECKRILKPGGKLVILTPNFESLGHKIFRSQWLGLDVSRHLVLFTANTLSEAIQKGGLKVAILSTTGRISEFLWLVSYNLKKYNQNAYFVKTTFLSRFMAKAFDKKIRLLLVWNKKAGDELVMVAIK